jgi:predicted dehydrogenase
MDRRAFMKSSLAAASSLYVSASAEGQEKGKEDDINVALLGAGAQGQVLLDACLKIPNVRFKAVCDIWAGYNRRRVARLLGRYGHEARDYEDYSQMLAASKDLDAVIIATPDFWHARHTIACLEAGLHVYCEKEMSNCLDEGRNMVEAARRTGKLLQIGHQRRSNPRYVHCREKLINEAKLLGRITTVNGQWNRAAREDLGWPQKYEIDEATLRRYGFESMHQFRNWRWYKKLGGGPMVDLGSHQIDIYNWFLDCPPAAVTASGGVDYFDRKTHEWYDTVMSIYEYDTPQGKVRASYQTITTNSYGGYYELFLGDQGTLLISEAAGRAGVYREQSAPQWDGHVKSGLLNAPKENTMPADSGAAVDVRETLAPPSYDLPVAFNDPYHKPHLENFFDAVRGKAKLNCPAEVGYETAVTVLKVNEAVEKARRLAFDAKEFKVCT